jgi:hypothetical protein
VFNFVSGFMKKVDARIDAMMNQMGVAFVAEARRLVPKDTHQLEYSIGYTYRQDTKTFQGYADMPYAMAVEFGTSRQRAQPYLRPALMSLRGFKLGSVNTELSFQTKSGGKAPATFPEGRTARANEKVNARLNRGVIRRTRVRVRHYDPHRPLS